MSLNFLPNLVAKTLFPRRRLRLPSPSLGEGLGVRAGFAIKLPLVSAAISLLAIACQSQIASDRASTPQSPPTSPTSQVSPQNAPSPTSAASLPIIDRPIKFTERRKQLTLDYIRLHYDPKATEISIVPRMVVIHWTDTPSLSATFNTFDPVLLAGRPELQKGGAVNVSTQFVVDRDGKIYRLMPETTLARHVIGLNHTAIGIENVGGERSPLTEKQLKSNVELLRYLVQKYPTIRFAIGHYEYQKFRTSPLWKELLPGYITFKSDPSREFMSQLRAKIEDLNLCSEYRPPNCQ
jgi:N-acetylmuramoyl-L-alanine amidase